MGRGELECSQLVWPDLVEIVLGEAEQEHGAVSCAIGDQRPPAAAFSLSFAAPLIGPQNYSPATWVVAR